MRARGSWGQGVLTDVPGHQPQGLEHQRLLPPLRDAVQDPALDKEQGGAVHYFLKLFTYSYVHLVFG